MPKSKLALAVEEYHEEAAAIMAEHFFLKDDAEAKQREILLAERRVAWARDDVLVAKAAASDAAWLLKEFVATNSIVDHT